MRLNILAINSKQSNFVSLFVVYVLISVFSVVRGENVTSNAIYRESMTAAAAAAATAATNSTQLSASLTSAAGINKTIDGGATPTITSSTTTTVHPSLAAAATVTSQVHQKERPHQKSTPLQKLQQQRQEKHQQSAKWSSTKGIRPVHGNGLFCFRFFLLFIFFSFDFVFVLFSIHKSFSGFSFIFLLFSYGRLFLLATIPLVACAPTHASAKRNFHSLFLVALLLSGDKMINFYVYGYPLHV